ncbi:MAG: hypothetical protein D6769_01070, partial [Methanobacteriota archaeon]
MESNTKATIVVVVTVVAFLLFYGGYNNSTSSLDISLVAKIVSFSDVGFSLDQLNKIAALSGLTLLSMAFLL